MPLYSYFIFSLNDRACQQLAKLLLLGGEEKSSGRAFVRGARAPRGKDNAISDV